MANKRTSRIWAAELLTVAGCIAGCFLLARCDPGYSAQADVWVAGGGYLMYGVEGATLSLVNQNLGVDTASLAYVLFPNPKSMAAVHQSCDIFGASINKHDAPLAQLLLPGANGAGVQSIDVTPVLNKKGGPVAPVTISSDGLMVSSVALTSYGDLMVTHPLDGSVSYYSSTTNKFSQTRKLSAGRRPTLAAADQGEYVISNSDLVKVCGGCETMEVGSAPVDSGVSDLAAGQGYVVAPSLASDNVYVFLDADDDKPPQLHGMITTTGGSPAKVAISHTSPIAYITIFTGTEGMDPGYVYILDLPTMRITNQTNPIHVGACPFAIAIARTAASAPSETGDVTFKDSSILVGNQCGNTLSRIDAGTNAVTQTISLPGAPNAIGVRTSR